MVTYFNAKDMSQYSEWVFKKNTVIPENFVVEVKGTREDSIMMQCYNEACTSKGRDEFIYPRLRVVDSTPFPDTSENGAKACIGWCFGIINGKIRKFTKKHLFENDFHYDSIKVELIPVEIFLIHALGLHPTENSVQAWINSKNSPNQFISKKNNSLRDGYFQKMIKIGEDMKMLCQSSISVNRENLNYSSRDFEYACMGLIDAKNISSCSAFELVQLKQRQAINLINDYSVSQDMKLDKVLRLIQESIDKAKTI